LDQCSGWTVEINPWHDIRGTNSQNHGIAGASAESVEIGYAWPDRSIMIPAVCESGLRKGIKREKRDQKEEESYLDCLSGPVEKMHIVPAK